ncbi:MAG: arsenite methyltransferase [Firmicutes bacterium]|nr:arsenite methyltransferase [Bacillota bacterium]
MENIKQAVREKYGSIAEGKGCGCGPVKTCCGSAGQLEQTSKSIGYSDEELANVPEGSNLGLGCGNPTAHAAIKEGDTVLDLGSGAGFDCFLAARKVGSEGRVIGVDMTHSMLDKARENAKKGGYTNVEFRLGEIEHLPVADNSVDIIISNCVINLSPEKEKVFAEALRVLKPTGRFFISDIVLLKELHPEIKKSVEHYVGCVAGADLKADYLRKIQEAGFVKIEVTQENHIEKQVVDWSGIPWEAVEESIDSIVSIKVTGSKPCGKNSCS